MLRTIAAKTNPTSIQYMFHAVQRKRQEYTANNLKITIKCVPVITF